MEGFRRERDVEQLVSIEGVQNLSASAWTRDGTALLFHSRTAATANFNVNVLSLQEERSWTPLIASAVNEGSPALSPDGSWVAYNSNETGQNEVYMERVSRPWRETTRLKRRR